VVQLQKREHAKVPAMADTSTAAAAETAELQEPASPTCPSSSSLSAPQPKKFKKKKATTKCLISEEPGETIGQESETAPIFSLTISPPDTQSGEVGGDIVHEVALAFDTASSLQSLQSTPGQPITKKKKNVRPSQKITKSPSGAPKRLQPVEANTSMTEPSASMGDSDARPLEPAGTAAFLMGKPSEALDEVDKDAEDTDAQVPSDPQDLPIYEQDMGKVATSPLLMLNRIDKPGQVTVLSDLKKSVSMKQKGPKSSSYLRLGSGIAGSTWRMGKIATTSMSMKESIQVKPAVERSKTGGGNWNKLNKLNRANTMIAGATRYKQPENGRRGYFQVFDDFRRWQRGMHRHFMGASRMRKFLSPLLDAFNRSAASGYVRFTCIFIALFFADLFVLAQVSNDWILDSILTIVFVIFSGEFLVLCVTDASYLFSFFFFMDFISTLSMVTDISYMLGTSATEPVHIEAGDSHSSSKAVMRLTRIARLATRAGRVTRLSKALWMCIGEVDKRNQSSVLKVLTAQIRSTLTMRLSSIMFMVGCTVPITLMFLYPVSDESLIVWPEVLNNDVLMFYSATNKTRLSLRLASFVKFFTQVDYGPGHVCFRRDVHHAFECNPADLGITWRPGFEATTRGGSLWKVTYGSFQVTFDMSGPQKLEAVGNCFLILMMLLCLIVFAIDLNRHVTRLALNPLGRVLTVVQFHCKKIFAYTEDMNAEIAYL